jgi:hypothetical protein
VTSPPPAQRRVNVPVADRFIRHGLGIPRDAVPPAGFNNNNKAAGNNNNNNNGNGGGLFGSVQTGAGAVNGGFTAGTTQAAGFKTGGTRKGKGRP